MIDTLTMDDAAAAAGLSAAFGWPHRAADWDLFLRVGRGLGWRVDGVLQATAMWFPLGGAHASIGGVQVAPSLQGQGIGRRLMEAVMADAAPRALMLHATGAGMGLYVKLGFRHAGAVRQFQGECASAPVTDGAVRPAAHSDRAAITALDAASRLARDDVMDLWMADAMTLVHGAPGAVTGYAVRRPFGRGALIGPVVADDEATALALVVALAVPGFLRIDIAADAERLAAWAGAAGLDCVGGGQLMQLGDWPTPVRGRVWALATQALG